MEKFTNPYIDKLAGISKEQIELERKWHEYIIHNIETIGGQKIEDFEVSKTPEDIELINFVEQSADAILQTYGREKKITVPLDNIHLLINHGTEQYTEGRLETGGHSTTQKSIIVDRMASDIEFSLVLFHEMMHLKSYSAIQILPDGETTAPYRSGISVISRDGDVKYLGNTEEAIVGYLTGLFYSEIILTGGRFKDETNSITSKDAFISRQPELQQLNRVVDLIFDKNSKQFNTRAEVFDLFVRAQVNGNLYKLSKLVKDTFGLGLKEIDFKVIN